MDADQRPGSIRTALRLGEEPGTEPPEKFLEWLSLHPTAGPVLDSIPRELDVYLDGDV